MTKDDTHGVKVRRFEQGCMYDIVNAHLSEMGAAVQIKLTAFRPKYVVDGKTMSFRALIAYVDAWRVKRGMEPLATVGVVPPKPKKKKAK